MIGVKHMDEVLRHALAHPQPDEFLLTRLIITCCVADATIAQVRVVGVPPGKFASNDWVNVTGNPGMATGGTGMGTFQL